MNQISDLIAGQKIASLNRIEQAYLWLAKQDLHDAKGIGISTHDYFRDKVTISIHLTFDSKEKARYWAAKHLRDIKIPEVVSGIMSYYAQDFPDFSCYCHFSIEHTASAAV